MSKERKLRVCKAYQAMKDIGIEEDKAAPVLKDLLRLYDNKWEHIEDENYRALADAIFERDQTKVEEHPRENMDNDAQDLLEEEAQEAEEPERPLKRLKQGHLDGKGSSINMSNTNTTTVPPGRPEEKVTKLNGTRGMEESPWKNAKRTTVTQLPVTPQSLGLSKEKQPSPSNSLVHENDDSSRPSSISRSQQSAGLRGIPSHPMTLRDRGAGVASLQTQSKDKRPVPKSSHGGDSVSRNSTVREDCTPEPALQSDSERNAADCTTALYESRFYETSRGECSSTFEIASSSSGEVKLSLSYKLAHGRPNFHMPSLEAVLKSVEDKCIRSSKALDPNISMMVLMKKTCECFLELGTDLKRQSVIMDAAKPSVTDVRGAKALGISLNALADSRPVTKAPQRKNGMNGGPQLKELDAEDEIVINRENQGNCGQPQPTCQISRSIHDVVDIARGQEKFVITVVNDVNDERPPSFCYIRQSAIFQNAYANFSLARIGDNNSCATCSGDCLSLSVPCACSHESGGEFAYTADGLVKEELLKECISMNRDPEKHCQYFCKECPLERSKGDALIEPCKGHLVRSFIKECWIKCGCNMQCGNRVVQRGISRKLQVFMTPEGKGWGLRTLEDLPKGAFVCEYVGEVLTNAELFERVSRSPEGEKHSYPVLLDADWCAEGVLKDEEALCLDATYYGNVARFINHKCYDSTLVEIPVEVETPDHHYYHLAFFTSRKVKAMEELTWDYGIDFDDHGHPIKAFNCQCGSRFCRNKRSRSRRGRR